MRKKEKHFYVCNIRKCVLNNGTELKSGRLLVSQSILEKIESKHMLVEGYEHFKTPMNYLKHICNNFTEIRVGGDLKSFALCATIEGATNISVIRLGFKKDNWFVISAYEPTGTYLKERLGKTLWKK